MGAPAISPTPWRIGGGYRATVVDADGKAVCVITPRKGAWNGGLLASAQAMLEALRDLLHADFGDFPARKEEARRKASAILARIDGEA